MRAGIFAGLWMMVAAVAAAQEVAIIVPQSGPALNRSFLFSDPASGTLILLYEKRIVSPTTVALEIRRQDNLNPVRRLSLKMKPRELLRLAEYSPPYGIFAIVQSFPEVSVLKIDPATGKFTRTRLYTLEEAQQLDRSIRRIDPAGLTWDDRLQKAYVLLNLPGEATTKTLLASFDSNGVRSGAPVRIDAGKGEHLDLVYNTCRGDLAATTGKVVRLLRSPATRPLVRPEEIAFDPGLCSYAVVRRQFTEIPQFYYLNASLDVQSFRQLPGGVAPQLFSQSRDTVVFNAQRGSFIYPTWANHQRLYINEITPAGIQSSVLETPIDSSSMSVASQGDRVFLLLSGLQFGTFERLHRLVLMRIQTP